MHVIRSSKLYSFESYDKLIESKSSYDLLQSLIGWRILSKTKYQIKIDYYEYNTKIFITFEMIYKGKLWLFEKHIYNFPQFVYLHKKMAQYLKDKVLM